ncbi:MAG: hypothetical protein J6M31_05950 [Bacteroidales bacterium]|nr:hypothetical protein [Bacteroidales bacterium]
MTNQKTGNEYIGNFQFKDTIREELQGPIGKGKVLYKNGDRFEGYFHLSFAHISGPCYCADGTYTFADGSAIEKAWIVTSSDLEVMDLLGVFLVKHPGAPDTISSFLRNKRHGLEVVLADQPYAIEWFEGKKVQELEIASYTFENRSSSEDLKRLSVVLNDGTEIVAEGGKMEANNYEGAYYDPALSGHVTLPDGTYMSYHNYPLKGLKPYDGYADVHTPQGRLLEQRWENGTLKEEKAGYSRITCKKGQLPDPFGTNALLDACIWDERVDYNHGQWIYEGPLQENLPHGKGVLYGNSYDTKGRRYEGSFKNGLLHGHGILSTGDLCQEGQWYKGEFQEEEAPEAPIWLEINQTESEWEVYSKDKDFHSQEKLEAKVGAVHFSGFGGMRIDRVTKNAIHFCWRRETRILFPGETLNYYNEIEGREWSDGCVYDGTEYYLHIHWPKA